jgi:DNA-binding beta-propeller fold protein YncE
MGYFRHLLPILALLTCAPGYSQTTEPFRLGAFEVQVDGLHDPAAVAIDEDGLIYIADSTAHRVVVLDRQGQVVASWGQLGSQPGQFRGPTGIAVSDEIFVSDGGNNRVQVFDKDGVFRRAWGGLGTEAGAFNGPGGIAVHGGAVFVADRGNDRVQVFDLDGQLRTSFGQEVLNGPVDVAVDDHEQVYVADSDSNRVQRFSADGTYLDGWGDWGPFVGLLDGPGAVVLQDDVVFVADTRNHRIQMFEPDGELINVWGMHSRLPRQGEGHIHYPADLAVAPDGSFAVICEPWENRVQIFAAAEPGERAAVPMPVKRAQGTHFGPHATIANDLLIIGEPETHVIDVFRIDGDLPILITQFGSRGTGYHQLIRPTGLAADEARMEILAADGGLRRVQRFRLDYDPATPVRYSPFMTRLVQSYDLEAMRDYAGPEAPWPIRPEALCRHPDGRIFLADSQNAQVHVYDADMQWIDTWGRPGSGPGELIDPRDMALSSDGKTLYVVDGGNHRVQAFATDGTYLFSLGGYGRHDGGLLDPRGVAAGVDGFVYVTDAGAHTVNRFQEDGTFLSRWGQPGYQDQEFWKPAGLVQAPDGRLFVIDYGNHRCQVFGPDGQWLMTFGLGRPSTVEKPRKY